jgi:hypothetical protein
MVEKQNTKLRYNWEPLLRDEVRGTRWSSLYASLRQGMSILGPGSAHEIEVQHIVVRKDLLWVKDKTVHCNGYRIDLTFSDIVEMILAQRIRPDTFRHAFEICNGDQSASNGSAIGRKYAPAHCYGGRCNEVNR